MAWIVSKREDCQLGRALYHKRDDECMFSSEFKGLFSAILLSQSLNGCPVIRVNVRIAAVEYTIICRLSFFQSYTPYPWSHQGAATSADEEGLDSCHFGL